MFSVRATILLLLLLLIPYAFRQIGVEPYPAVVLPEGSSVLHVKQGFSFNYFEVYGLNKASKWQRIDLVSIMKPLPGIYFGEVIEHAYNDGPSKKNKIEKILSKLALPKKEPVRINRDYLFISNLSKLHLNPTLLRLVYYKKTIDIKTGFGLTTIANEKLIHLSK